jgi:hypothetical protein
MAAGPIIEPAFEVAPLDELGAGHLVCFAGKGNEDELAFTALEEREQGEKERLLIILDRKNSDGERFPPMARPAADTAAQPGVLIFPQCKIEPVTVVVTDAANNRDDGTILASGSRSAYLVASQRLDHGRARRVAVCLNTGAVLRAEALEDWRTKNHFVAVTKWKLWVPQFSDGERPKWKCVFKFPPC